MINLILLFISCVLFFLIIFSIIHYEKYKYNTYINYNFKNIENKFNLNYYLPKEKIVDETRNTLISSKLLKMEICKNFLNIEIGKTKSKLTIKKYVQKNYVKSPIYNDPVIVNENLNFSYQLNEMILLNVYKNIYLRKFILEVYLFLIKNHNLNFLKINDDIIEDLKKFLKKVLKVQNETLTLCKDEVDKNHLWLSKKYNKMKNKLLFFENKKNITNKDVKKIFELEDSEDVIKKAISKYEFFSLNIEKIFNMNLTYLKDVVVFLNSQNIKLKKIYDEDDYESVLSFLNKTNIEEFKGCYIIKNIINQKCYVGQSKNVIKRIHQHFNNDGSPKNKIFYEDYYSTYPLNNSLFEIKFYKCSTKDELDSLEKALIKELNSFNYGYNRTSGNY